MQPFILMSFLHLALLLQLAGCSGRLYTISCRFSHETVFADEGSQGWRLKHPHQAGRVYSRADKRSDCVPEVPRIELLMKVRRLAGARINFDCVQNRRKDIPASSIYFIS